MSEDKKEYQDIDAQMRDKFDVIDKLDRIQKTEDEMIERQKLADKKYFVSMGSLAIILLISIAYIIISSTLFNKRIARTVIEMTKIKDGFKLADSHSINERKEKFRKFMIRIINTYGMTYRVNMKPPAGLSSKEKREYILKCWDWARLTDIPEYWVPQLHHGETCFNPWAWNKDSGLNEKGIGQQTWDTVLTAMAIVKYIMPDKLRRELDFTVRDPNDMYDWENSTKATFILIWYYMRRYNYREEWAVSCYKWNNWLGRRWDDGKGDIPAKFTISGIDYSPIAYYTHFKSWVEAWEIGDIEPGRVNAKYWASFEKKMMKSEVNLRRSRGIIRKQKRLLEEKNEIEQDLADKYKEIEEYLKVVDKKLTSIYGKAGKQKTGESIRAELKKHKKVVMSAIRKLKSMKEDKKSITEFIVIIISAILFVIGIMGYIIWRRRKDRHR